MMASSTNSWLHTNLLPQHDSQQQNSSHVLYHNSENLLHGAPSSHLNQSQHLELGHGSHAMETYCQPLHHTLHAGLHLLGDSQQPVQPANVFPGSSGRVAGSNENGDPTSARKVHKADREKLRRDRLNEQFGELAGVLDPDRPKNDKATILGDSVQVVKELRAEVKRLKYEQTTLLDESRDVSLSHSYLCPITSWKNTKIFKVVQISFLGEQIVQLCENFVSTVCNSDFA
jgi:hypothetical protein